MNNLYLKNFIKFDGPVLHNFGKEQIIFDVGGGKIDSQPGELPNLLISSLVHDE